MLERKIRKIILEGIIDTLNKNRVIPEKNPNKVRIFFLFNFNLVFI